MKTLLLSTILLFTVNLNAQNVYIPDAQFKSYLVNNSAINTNEDNEIQVSEAIAFTGTIDCNTQNISALTGIEAFSALTYLYCYNNQLTSLDVSSNIALETLHCASNQLTSLDIFSNTALTLLNCQGNQIASLDLSNSTALETIYCGLNQLISLDVSSNTSLTFLDCFQNQLTSLDVSNNTSLGLIGCGANQLASLDVSNNTALTVLYCNDNQLECLNFKNGNNTLLISFLASGNLNLTCIEVDDVSYSIANWTSIDPWASFSTDCNNNGCSCIPTSSTDPHIACDSYTWLDGNTYTVSNNSATYTTTNAAGCDSVITIDLTINPTPSAAVTQNGATLTATQTGSTYQWLDCDDESVIVGEINQSFTPSTTGNYAVFVIIGDCFKKSDCFLVDFTGIGEMNNTPAQLLKIVDVLGRETQFKLNIPLLYIYDDGKVERKMIIK